MRQYDSSTAAFYLQKIVKFLRKLLTSNTMQCIVLCNKGYGDDMDSQLKKGLLEGCVLATIRDEESYGYKIISQISPYVDISESTLYPILKRLEASGAVKVHNRLYNGRLRKYYRITDKGRERLNEFYRDMEQLMSIYRFLQN